MKPSEILREAALRVDRYRRGEELDLCFYREDGASEFGCIAITQAAVIFGGNPKAAMDYFSLLSPGSYTGEGSAWFTDRHLGDGSTNQFCLGVRVNALLLAAAIAESENQ
jgi:hypothetical protein